MDTLNLVIEDQNVRVIPTSWRQEQKYQSFESRCYHVRHLVELSYLSAPNGPLLILWPETTVEFPLLHNGLSYDFPYEEIKPYIQRILPKNSLILGGAVLRLGDNRAYNTMFGLPDKGDITYVYFKKVLAPFGEFMPPILRRIANKLGIRAMDDFMRGREDQPLLTLFNGLKIKPLICYEGSFTGRVLHSYQTANALTVSTNDAWFGYNGKEQQFISHAFRTVEEGIAMIRCANMGFSGYVSPIGTYVVSLSDKPMDIKFHKPLPETPYRWVTNRCKYWIELLLCFFVLCILLLEVRHRSRIIKNKKHST